MARRPTLALLTDLADSEHNFSELELQDLDAHLGKQGLHTAADWRAGFGALQGHDFEKELKDLWAELQPLPSSLSSRPAQILSLIHRVACECKALSANALNARLAKGPFMPTRLLNGAVVDAETAAEYAVRRKAESSASLSSLSRAEAAIIP